MTQHKPIYKTISVLGASITNGYFDSGNLGWVTRLGQKLQEDKPGQFFIRNFAVSGDRIPDCLARFRSQVLSNPGDCLIIACGSNDIARWGARDAPTSLSHEFRQEIWSSFLREAKQLFDFVYVCQVLPVDESKVPARQNDQGLDQFYRNDDVDLYNDLIQKLCVQYDCSYINFSRALKDVDWNALLFDDVHPNKDGHAFISRFVYQAVNRDLLALFDDS